MAPATTSPSAPARPAVLGGVAGLDAAVSLRLHALFLPVPRLLLKALEVAGDGRIWLPVPISLLLLSASPANASGAVSPLLAGLVAGLVIDLALVGLVKVAVRRPRPAYNAKDMYVAVAADHWSFPSGHSSRAFLVAAFLAAGGFRPREALFLWAAATSASRVLLGRHYVIDVVAGAFLGVFEAWLSNLLLRIMCAQSTFLSSNGQNRAGADDDCQSDRLRRAQRLQRPDTVRFAKDERSLSNIKGLTFLQFTAKGLLIKTRFRRRPHPENGKGKTDRIVAAVPVPWAVELKKQNSACLELVNKTDQFVAFKVKTTNPRKYAVRPASGVVPPRGSFGISITMQAPKEIPPDYHCKDKFLVQSIAVEEGTAPKDIVPDMFSKAPGKLVEEFKLRVIYVPANPPSPVPEEAEDDDSLDSDVDHEVEIPSASKSTSGHGPASRSQTSHDEDVSMVSKSGDQESRYAEENKKIQKELKLDIKASYPQPSIMTCASYWHAGTKKENVPLYV
ncbi:uncharacterized protein C2845_PM11G31140 [Panicum miliaceum]|uniref:MSP domain-containing protein n=1 Tax=Panicum miliaceum TaxID=4540 RepID=A0A3L6RWI8_PANMI|nr:uncharacterized protein C2845_PM11G31140 [Panicum miliaceum]